MYPHNIGKTLRAVIWFSLYMSEIDMRKITRKDINKYRVYLTEEYFSREGDKLIEDTITFRMNCLSRYFKFLLVNGYIEKDPTSGIEIRPDGKEYPEYLPTKEDVMEMVERADEYTYVGMRDRALLLMCYYCPLRTEDYKDIDMSDLDMKKRRLHPKGTRGGYPEGILIADEAYKSLDRYLKASRPVLVKRAEKDSGKLFINRYGEPFNEGTIHDLFDKYREEKRIRPYSMRHARAVHMLQEGAAQEEIQAFLGHKSMKTVYIYSLLVSDDLSGLYEKCAKRYKFKRYPKGAERPLETS
jgi:integrase/recombinase XerD